MIVKRINLLEKDDFFLEIGSAQGYFEGIAGKYSKNVFGGEYNFESLQKAKEKFPKAVFVGLNAEKLPFKSNAFDFVLCTEVLEHVPDWEAAFKELQRVSRKKILVTVPLERGYIWRTFSKVKGMCTRGHLHKLGSPELIGGLGRGWKVSEYELVTTPSRRINRRIKTRLGEKLSMYAMLLLEKEE